MKRRFLLHSLPILAAATLGLKMSVAWAADEAPDALVKRLTQEVIDRIQADKDVQSGDIASIMALAEEKVMPHVNFQRMTASAVGPAWRRATPEQRTRLQDEFKTLLVRTYSGAMSQAKNLTFSVKPMRSAPQDQEVIVRTLIKGRGDPVQLDYRMEKTPGEGAGWKIFNLNVLGVWLVDTYRSQFSAEINAKGIDGLISTLSERNKSNAAGDAKPAKG